MTLRLAARAAFRPGQFMNLGLHLPSGFVSRSYSLASVPEEPLEVLLARLGEGELTPALFELREGASVWLDPKPQGFFTFVSCGCSRPARGSGPFCRCCARAPPSNAQPT